MTTNNNYEKLAYRAYCMQRGAAKSRGIEWLFGFDEWLAWWESTGKFEERGRGSNKYVMSRYNDEGPYSLSNVFCQTFAENLKEAHKLRAQKSRGQVQ